MRLSIRNKLLLGYLVKMLLLIGTAVVMVRAFSASNDRLVHIINISAERISLSHQLQVEILEATRNEKNIILEQEAVQKEIYRTRIQQSVTNVNAKIAQLHSISDEPGRAILAEFSTTFKNYSKNLDTIISLAMAGKTDEAFAISSQKASTERDVMTLQLQKLVDKNVKSMETDRKTSDASYSSALNVIFIFIIVSILLGLFVSLWITRSTTKRISTIAQLAERIASREFTSEKIEDSGSDELNPVFISLANINESFREVTESANSVASGNYSDDFSPRSEKDGLGNSLQKMTRSLRESTAANQRYNWLMAGKNFLNEKLLGDLEPEEMAGNTITSICSYIGAGIGAIYLYDENRQQLTLSGRYAFTSPEHTQQTFRLNEGLIGQAAAEQKQFSVTAISDDQLRITSSVLNAKPRHVLITPFSFEGKILGVIETGRQEVFTDLEKEFLDNSMEMISIAITSAIARRRIRELLEKTQAQSEELQSQQEELRQMNEELEEQAQNLKQQQEELQMSNEELEEQTQALELKNKEMLMAKMDIEQKTAQLEISSRYKSEFLANMSHELRTPLNSMLILSKDLSENKKKNLMPDQVESAEIIYKGGNDLLRLINEVLDLSKIEAGRMDMHVEKIALRNFISELARSFKATADEKGLQLRVRFADDAPEFIQSDMLRLSQVLKNLLSNAVKFTEKGSVELSVSGPVNESFVIAVSDTGIGIPEEKQLAVFEAFMQADGGTSRKYGGTGLGLSISRELAHLLGGEIKLVSRLNEGSTFSLTIPLSVAEKDGGAPAAGVSKARTERIVPQAKAGSEFLNYPTLEDDRATITKTDKVVLLIEDDMSFAGILLKQANSKGFKCLSAATGEDGLLLAEKYIPQAIILDLELPGINGHHVLAQLKANPSLRHIPVHIISAKERSIEAIKEGAIEYLMKPVTKEELESAFVRISHFVERKMKNLLIIEDDDASRKAMRKLIGNGDVKCFEAGSGKTALDIYREQSVDCIVLDLGLPDMNGFELIYQLEKAKEQPLPPIIIYTGRELTREENEELQKYAETIIIKGIKSEERLLDETALFLHRTISNLPESKQQIITSLYDKDSVFRGKKVMVVDDDMRNVFALSKVLKDHGMEVIKAENGKNALEQLAKEPGIQLVLMDIMMPEMDGYEAMRRIRQQGIFRDLPIIALTAKAMKDDKQKCIDAGANDYIPKPVDVERLLTLMRVWLSKNK